ncbi:MAG: transposase [Myxococcales bacterium]|nr:transposase [Myxococcales bacterium]
MTFIQRSDSALRLNVHFHTLALDGVYVRDAQGALVFHALPPPSGDEVAEVAAWTTPRFSWCSSGMAARSKAPVTRATRSSTSSPCSRLVTPRPQGTCSSWVRCPARRPASSSTPCASSPRPPEPSPKWVG